MLQSNRLAFDNYEIGEFFQELLKKFSYKKDEEDRKPGHMNMNCWKHQDWKKKKKNPESRK